MKTGNTVSLTLHVFPVTRPQWSPVMKTGNTGVRPDTVPGLVLPQWSPVMKTGNTSVTAAGPAHEAAPSMEPGHEDREYRPPRPCGRPGKPPQWSPVMKTGNTHTPPPALTRADHPQWSPVMKTGNTRPAGPSRPRSQSSLNGARS